MHSCVHDDHRETATARSDSNELADGGAQYLARIVIQSRPSEDADFEINHSTYADGFSYINNLTTFDNAGFPITYFGRRPNTTAPAGG